jgi:hypothetical protein
MESWLRKKAMCNLIFSWPAVVLNPMETSGNSHVWYRKMLGKQFIVGLFE